MFLLHFADDVILLSNTIVGLQNQLDSLKKEAGRLYLTVNLFRVDGQLATRERWLYGNAVVKVTNAYKYLGMIFTTKLSVSAALSDVCKTKQKTTTTKQKQKTKKERRV